MLYLFKIIFIYYHRYMDEYKRPREKWDFSKRKLIFCGAFQNKCPIKKKAALGKTFRIL